MSAHPATFGKYRILDRIAVGGMAEIYKAELDGVGGFHRTFAIKRILPHLGVRQDFVDMFVEEAKTAGLMSHANIVQIMDLGEVDGSYYIAMEYVDGPDLGRILRRCREKGITLPVPHAVFICIEVLKGLDYAHNRTVMRESRQVPLNTVHRDVSPSNVLVSFQGAVKLTDFGIAKTSVKTLQTVAGIIKGRFNYLSPEQAQGHPATQASDLFATGLLLYEMLTGKHPFARPTEPATLDAIRDAVFTPACEANPDVPYQLEQVLELTLAGDPAKRFASARQMKEALDQFFHDSGFIFSHSTLAAFLKGLFPAEARGEQPSISLGDPITRPLTLPDDADDRPTTLDEDLDLESVAFPANPLARADTHLRRRPSSLLDNLPDMSYSAALGPVAGLGDESTLIRSIPDGADAWGDAATVLRPRPDLEGVTRIRPAPTGAPTARPAPSPVPPRAAVRPPRTGGRPAPPRAVSEPRRHQFLYLLFGAVVTLLVLFVGVLLGVRAARYRNPAPIAQATVAHPPEIEVHMPDGASLHIDGRPVPDASGARLPLTVGLHVVKVEMADYKPVEMALDLAANDVRVLTFDAATLAPRRNR